MPIRHLVLACVWMASAAALAFADGRSPVEIAAGDLTEAVEALAKQSGVDVIYDTALVRGQKTQGVTGALSPTDAFRKLLDGTGLYVREEGSALLITKAASTSQPAGDVDAATQETSPDPIEEVTIEATRNESLSALYARLDSLKIRFYTAYNEVNGDPRYKVRCEAAVSRLSRRLVIRRHVCGPRIKQTCSGYGGPSESGGTTGGLCTTWIPEGYLEHLRQIVGDHPELRKMAEEHDALAEHYVAVRRERLKAKTFVWN